MENPTPRKVVDGRIIYKSRNFTRKQGWKAWGLPILSDFGTSRIADGDQEGIIQPYIYRAPEVVLGMKWNEKVDIWNIGVVVSYFSCSVSPFILRLTLMCVIAKDLGLP